jgi:hypothetical protein
VRAPDGPGNPNVAQHRRVGAMTPLRVRRQSHWVQIDPGWLFSKPPIILDTSGTLAEISAQVFEGKKGPD